MNFVVEQQQHQHEQEIHTLTLETLYEVNKPNTNMHII